MTTPQTAFFTFHFFLRVCYPIFLEFQQQPEGEANGGKETEREHKVQGRAQQASSITSGKQSSRARSNERTARRAIRRELPKQVAAEGADVESEACQLTGEAGRARHSSQQRAKIIN